MAPEPRNPLKPLISGMLGMGLAAVVALTLHGFLRLSDLQASRIAEAEQTWKTAEAERLKRVAARAKIDLTKAYGDLRRKAAGGDRDAQLLLGSILLIGMEEVVRIDPATGLRVSSADQFEAFVGKHFDELHEQPFTNVPAVPADPTAARHWLERAARQGQLEAQVRLAKELEPTAPREALRWIMIADRGWPPEKWPILINTHELRDELRQRLLNQFSPEQAAETQQQAAGFQAMSESR
jgi:TPR repeat protein